MNASRRSVPILVAALVIAPALAGCGGAVGSAPTPTATVTVTAAPAVTETPEPAVIPRSYDDALTELDAWSLCWGAVAGANQGVWTIQPFTPEAPLGGKTVVENADGTFQVTVMWAPTSGEGWAGEAICVAGGTVGDPAVELTGVRDYG